MTAEGIETQAQLDIAVDPRDTLTFGSLVLHLNVRMVMLDGFRST